MLNRKEREAAMAEIVDTLHKEEPTTYFRVLSSAAKRSPELRKLIKEVGKKYPKEIEASFGGVF